MHLHCYRWLENYLLRLGKGAKKFVSGMIDMVELCRMGCTAVFGPTSSWKSSEDLNNGRFGLGVGGGGRGIKEPCTQRLKTPGACAYKIILKQGRAGIRKLGERCLGTSKRVAFMTYVRVGKIPSLREGMCERKCSPQCPTPATEPDTKGRTQQRQVRRTAQSRSASPTNASHHCWPTA